MSILLLISLSILIFSGILCMIFESKSPIRGSHDDQFLNHYRSNNGQGRFYGYWESK